MYGINKLVHYYYMNLSLQQQKLNNTQFSRIQKTLKTCILNRTNIDLSVAKIKEGYHFMVSELNIIVILLTLIQKPDLKCKKAKRRNEVIKWKK